MFQSDKDLFNHILDEIQFLKSEVVKTDEDEFLSSDMKKRAFARSIEIIGEAVKNLSSVVISNNSHIKWRNISGMRDKLIHGYFSVNYKLVWDVAKNLIPDFEKQILEIKDKNPELFS